MWKTLVPFSSKLASFISLNFFSFGSKKIVIGEILFSRYSDLPIKNTAT